jgi:hypothetical protein
MAGKLVRVSALAKIYWVGRCVLAVNCHISVISKFGTDGIVK